MNVVKKDFVTVVGIAIKTSNDEGRAFTDIPVHWQRFFEEGVAKKITDKVSDDIYGVYTHFENEGVNSDGLYTFLIGCPVKSSENLPQGLSKVEIPASSYQTFPSATGEPQKVGQKWQEIWAYPFGESRTFKAEYECYRPNGEIEIFVGVK